MLTLSDSNSIDQNNLHAGYGGHEATKLGVPVSKQGGGGGGGGGNEAGGGSDGLGGEEGDRSGFALVVNGHSLVHALTDELELLLLGVAENCNGKSRL
jgi:hypothetical protein